MRILSLDKGNERDTPCPHDRLTQHSLVARTRSGHAAGQDLASLREIASEELNILVIYEIYLLRAKSAELPSLKPFLWCCHGISFLLTAVVIFLERLKIRCLVRGNKVVRHITVMRTCLILPAQKSDSLRNDLKS